MKLGINLKSKFGNIYLFFAILFLSVFTPLIFLLKWANSPLKKTSADVVYYVEDGRSLHEIAYGLASQEILDHPEFFKIYTKLHNHEKSIKFGTFVFLENNTPAEILKKLVEGDSVKIKVTLPDGLNIYQVAAKFSSIFDKHNSDYWLDLMHSPDLINDLPIEDPKPNSIEGFLFPDTYFFDPNEKPVHVLKSLVSHFKQVVTEDMLTRARELNLTPLQFITLASILQKESAVPTELNEISAVFFNRMKLHMRLQSDPTAIYGAWNEYKGRILKKHLRARNQYNTYVVYGLPVGPIASPGLLSLNAVLNPAKSNSLYFVAAGDGTHHFSDSYKKHRKAVRKYINYLKHKRSHAK